MNFVPLPEEMGREPDIYALILKDDDGDTAELVDGTVDVDVVFFRCRWISTTFLW